MRTTVMIVALTVAVGACAPEVAEPPPNPELVAVAQELCTVMWDWQLDIGGIMNAMSAASRLASDPAARQSVYRTSFAEARLRNQDLASTIDRLTPGPFVDRLREDIRNGLFAANQIITEIDTDVSSLHADGRNGYHDVVPRIFLGFEKVIDVAKPEMADYANPELSRAFVSVSQCQHGVKDVNDGIPRHVPRS